MNVHDSERMAGLLEQAGYEPDGRRPRRRRRRHQHLQRARARGGEALHAPRRASSSGRSRKARGRSSRSPAASRSRKAIAFSGARQRVDVIIGTQNIRRLPMLVDEAVERPDAQADRRPRSARRRVVSAGRSRGGRSGQGVRHDHRGLQRVLRLLRRAVHARPRAHAAGRRHPRRGAAGGRHRRAARSSCSARSSITTRRRTIRRATSPALLERLNDVDGLERIRFASPHPRHVTPRMIAAMRDLPEGLPAPAPAGAVRLDARPRRDAAAAHARGLPRPRRPRSATAMPDIALSTDMIVGFPGETDADFEETLSLTAAVRYHSMFSFKYSPRPNTLALEAAAGRRAGGREDAADRGAAGAAAGDSGRSCTSGGRARRIGAGRLRAAAGATGSSRGARAATRS